jgi:hypothetical protein
MLIHVKILDLNSFRASVFDIIVLIGAVKMAGFKKA